MYICKHYPDTWGNYSFAFVDKQSFFIFSKPKFKGTLRVHLQTYYLLNISFNIHAIFATVSFIYD